MALNNHAYKVSYSFRSFMHLQMAHNTQHKDIQHNHNQHKRLKCDTPHKQLNTTRLTKLNIFSMTSIWSYEQSNNLGCGPIHKLWRKWSVVNTVPVLTIFTTLHFLSLYATSWTIQSYNINLKTKLLSRWDCFIKKVIIYDGLIWVHIFFNSRWSGLQHTW